MDMESNNTIKWPIEKCLEYQQSTGLQIEYLTYNGSVVNCLEHAPTITKSTVIRAVVLITMALMSLLANLATMISIKKCKKLRGHARPSWTAIYCLIYQLSLADLLVTIFCLAGEGAWLLAVQWFAGNAACKLFKFLQMFSLYLSTFILVLIGVDRWLAVRYPMKSMGTAKRNERLVIFAWVLSMILSIPQAVVFHVARGPFVEEFYQCVTHGFYTEPWQEQLYTTLSLIFMFIIPLTILVATYVSTIKTIADSERVFEAETIGNLQPFNADFNRKKLIHRAKVKSLRISVVIVTAFVIWWTPYYVMMIIFTFHDPDKTQTEELQTGIFFFGMSNSLVNPLIYGAFHLWPKRRGKKRNDKDPSTAQGFHLSLFKRDTAASVRTTTMRLSNRSHNGHYGPPPMQNDGALAAKL